MFDIVKNVWDAGAAAVGTATQAVEVTRQGVVNGAVVLLDGSKWAIDSAKKMVAGTEAEPEPRRRVFVIHGRNLQAWQAISKFLEALGLRPYNYDAVQGEVGGGSPFVGDVVHYAMRKAHAVVALFTPDEFSVLDESMRAAEDREQWQVARWQARPNVIFEAGMAFGIRTPQREAGLGPAHPRGFRDRMLLRL